MITPYYYNHIYIYTILLKIKKIFLYAVAALVAITLWSGAMRYVVAKELGLRRSLLLGG